MSRRGTGGLAALAAWALVVGCAEHAELDRSVEPPGPPGASARLPAEDARSPASGRVAFSRGARPVVTGWEGQPERLSSARCGRCHVEEHEAWSGGMHARAWVDPLFQRAFAAESRRWCVNCHAPLLAQRRDPELRREGIGCAACHVRDGVVIGPRAVESADHDVREAPEMRTARFCAGCHQFPFPRTSTGPVTFTDRPMQNTFDEWRRAGAARCQSCHMDGHRLRGPHDRGWLREQLGPVEVELAGPLLHVGIELAERGHRLPTGDLFRSLALELARDARFETLYFRKRWGRSFGVGLTDAFHLSDRVVEHDSTIGPDRDRLTLTIDAPRAGPLHGRLVYYFHDPDVDRRDHRDRGARVVLWSEEIRE